MADQEIVLDPEELAIQRDARIAGYRKTIAEGTAATMPDLSVEVPDRSLDVGDGVSQLPGLIAQDAADEIADAVVQRIITDTSVVGRTMLVVTDMDITGASSLGRRMLADVTKLAGRLEMAGAALLPPEAASAVPLSESPGKEIRDMKGVEDLLMAFPPGVILGGLQAVQAAAKALPAALELLKTDVTVRSSPVEVADEVIVAAVARSLRQRDVAVRIAACTIPPTNAISAGLGALADARDALADALATFTAEHLQGGRAAEVDRQRAVLVGLVAAHDKLLDNRKPREELMTRISDLQKWVASNEPAVDKARAAAAAATALVEQASAYLTASHEPGEGGLSPATVAGLFHEVTKEGSTTDVLRIDCTRAVGESVWKERWRGDQATHVGGLGVSWVLIGADGLVRSAGEHTAARSVTVKLGEPLIWR